MRALLLSSALMLGQSIFSQNGVFDASFGSAGYAPLDPTLQNDNVSGLEVDHLRRPVVSGQNSGPVNTVCWVCRLEPEGAPDTSFGPNGCRIVNFCTSGDGITDMKLMPDGRIMCLGGEGWGQFSSLLDRAVTFRLNTDGTMDSTWAGTGLSFISVPGIDLVTHAMAIDAVEGVVVLGAFRFPTTSRYALWRYLPTGYVDTAFYNGGAVLEIPNETFGTSQEYRNMSLLSDGRIVVSGMEGAVFNGLGRVWNVVRCYLPNGQVDSTFAIDGVRYDTLDIGMIGSDMEMLVQADDRIVMYGTAFGPNGAGVGAYRYLPDGTPDPSFGVNGRAFLATANYGPSVKRGAQLSDGRIAFALRSAAYPYSSAVCIDPDGNHDLTFGNNGLATGPQSQQATELAQQSDSAVIVTSAPTLGSVSVLRYTLSPIATVTKPMDPPSPSFVLPVPSGGQDVRIRSGNCALMASNVHVRDLSGREVPVTVVQEGNGVLLSGSSELPPGVYLVEAGTACGNVVHRMVIDQ